MQEILSSTRVQRLHGVSFISGLCTAMAQPVTFSRYEHSVGVAYLADRAAGWLKLGADTAPRKALIVAALLHDVGHPPLSHITEAFLAEKRRRYHFHFTLAAVRSLMREKQIDGGVLGQSYEVLTRRSRYSPVIHGLLSSDNLDGLFRSQVFFGMCTEDPRKVVDLAYDQKEGAETAVECVTSMTRELYEGKLLEPVVLATEAMICRSMEIAASEDLSFVDELQSFGDVELIDRLNQNCAAKNLIDLLRAKMFFVPLSEVAGDLEHQVYERWGTGSRSVKGREAVAEWVAKRLGLRPECVIVYCKSSKRVLRRSGVTLNAGARVAPRKVRMGPRQMHVFVSPE
jgi:HD superfamily phosphohydrolase